jgi:Tol biopolymer transport system component
VAFAGPDGSLVAGDNNGWSDVFVWNGNGLPTELISQRNAALAPVTANGMSHITSSSVSADGQWIVFDSFATNLIPSDTNATSDVFAFNTGTGQVTLISAGLNGAAALGGPSYGGCISAGGRYVAFVSSATNLVAVPLPHDLTLPPFNPWFNIYRRDLQTGTTLLVTVTTNGTCADGNCSCPVISSDGRYIAFLSQSVSLVAGTPNRLNAYWRDLTASKTMWLSNSTYASAIPPSMSLDGRYVPYVANCGSNVGLKVRDTQTKSDPFTLALPVLGATISPDGSRLLLVMANAVDVYNVTNSQQFYFRSSLPRQRIQQAIPPTESTSTIANPIASPS